MKTHRVITVSAFVVLIAASALSAEIEIVVDHHGDESLASGFAFKNVPAPSQSDAAQKATFTLVDGRRDRNGGDLATLHNGRVPTDEDQPGENFFFAAGTDGGRVLVDLGKPIEIKQINTYSWHPSTRGPQVYTLYASDGKAEGFDPQPKKGTDPQTCGWKLVARVDTRPEGNGGGGQYGVSVCESDGTLGACRY
ncbi:MAG: hypothetical protein JW741_15515, partial [Sedimentisphaerales bacterium]|nr:hypothetical protein [Sedimentisphaerales bacterium]